MVKKIKEESPKIVGEVTPPKKDNLEEKIASLQAELTALRVKHNEKKKGPSYVTKSYKDAEILQTLSVPLSNVEKIGVNPKLKSPIRTLRQYTFAIDPKEAEEMLKDYKVEAKKRQSEEDDGI